MKKTGVDSFDVSGQGCSDVSNSMQKVYPVEFELAARIVDGIRSITLLLESDLIDPEHQAFLTEWLSNGHLYFTLVSKSVDSGSHADSELVECASDWCDSTNSLIGNLGAAMGVG